MVWEDSLKKRRQFFNRVVTHKCCLFGSIQGRHEALLKIPPFYLRTFVRRSLSIMWSDLGFGKLLGGRSGGEHMIFDLFLCPQLDSNLILCRCSRLCWLRLVGTSDVVLLRNLFLQRKRGTKKATKRMAVSGQTSKHQRSRWWLRGASNDDGQYRTALQPTGSKPPLMYWVLSGFEWGAGNAHF